MKPLSLLLLTGCSLDFAADSLSPGEAPDETTGGEDGGGDGGSTTTDPGPAYAPSVRADLRLKRWRQLSLDLEGALELPEDELCRETGLYDCTTLHVVPLGGISADNGLYAPQEQQSVTTGLAIERLALQACMNRLELDRAAEVPVVFSLIDLDATELADADADAQATELWHRLLARDPSAEELEGARALYGSTIAEGGDNGAWAAMLCFALATSTEALTY